jgi:polar amino acid transport system substrate-binding protein
MLAMDRIDVAVIERLEGLHFVRSMGLRDVTMLAPAYVEGDWFLYLNKKHAALAPRLAEQIRLMKRDGSYQRIFDQALGATSP